MATTRIIFMHVNQGRTIADCLTDRIGYSKNPDKTQGGELISAYECDPKTADAEFLFSKRQYRTITGREQQHDVIAYQVRQSFRPGEITPEEANRVGYAFAERFLKGKLEDGNLCKECAKKLSPFFSDRRNSTVAEIREQLDYREANKEKVAAFNPTKSIGGRMNIYFDEDKRQWLATQTSNWRSFNPDVMDFSQVTGCTLDIDESKRELKRKDSEGKEVSFNPPRYAYSYDFNMIIHVNTPYFSEIRFQINDDEISQRGSFAYRDAQAKADEIKDTLMQIRDAEREAAVAASAPKASMECPYCGAVVVPDASGKCAFCGSVIGI